MFHELDTVALTRDLSEYGLKAGTEGVVLLTHDWAEPQGLTLEFFVGSHPWTPESGEDYPAVTLSLPADQVRLVKRHETHDAGQMSANQIHAVEERMRAVPPRQPSR
ncbi:MAG: DUF4926 domain-containing protein [Thermomicrobia bacterium]|nr:DUF4926 domain-containing protein [Thermomicrobia bacterium]